MTPEERDDGKQIDPVIYVPEDQLTKVECTDDRPEYPFRREDEDANGFERPHGCAVVVPRQFSHGRKVEGEHAHNDCANDETQNGCCRA